MRKIFFGLILFVLAFNAGCAKHPQMYAWGDYSESLYNLKKEPTAENLANHKKILLEIMEESKEQSLRVPPGVYCEYGYILLKEGKSAEAMEYFDREQKTYPESTVFVQRLIADVNKQAAKAKESR